MKPLAPFLAAFSLVACALSAQAEPVTVSAGGTVTLEAFGANPVQTSLHFAMDSQVAGPNLQPGINAFTVHDLAVQFTYGNVTQTIATNELSWFDYGNGQYAGFDFRLHDVLAQGDMLQFIWSPGVVFSGPASAPTLSLMSLGPIGGMACYAVVANEACSPSFFSDGHYSVAGNQVPEPSTLALLPLALGLAAGATRRRKA